MIPFTREGTCESCGRKYSVSGASLNPGTETEAPARFQCDCGGWSNVFIPGSVNTDKLVVTPIEETELTGPGKRHGSPS